MKEMEALILVGAIIVGLNIERAVKYHKRKKRRELIQRMEARQAARKDRCTI